MLTNSRWRGFDATMGERSSAGSEAASSYPGIKHPRRASRPFRTPAILLLGVLQSPPQPVPLRELPKASPSAGGRYILT